MSADALGVSNFTAFVDFVRARTEADELFVIGHDLETLHSLTEDHGESVRDEQLLDSILGGDVVSHNGRVFTPFMNRLFPLVVAASAQPLTIDLDGKEIIGPLAGFHRELFDVLEHRRRGQPLVPAAELQWSLLPVRATAIGNYEIAGALQPAATIAGDAYDFAVDPAGNLTACVMDAMGHGVTATLSTSLALATIRTVRIEGGSLVEQVCAADEAILAEYGGARFVTMVAISCTDERIQIVNAGHEPMREVSASGDVTTVSVPADPPLGLEGRTDYQLHTRPPLQVGEAIAMISDGAPSSKDQSGKTFGSEAVNRALSELRGKSSLQTADRFGRAILKFIDGDLQDDLTTVILQRNS